MKFYSYTLVVMTCQLVFHCPIADAQNVSTWEKLNDSFGPVDFKKLDLDEFKQSGMFSQLFSNDQKSMFIEMASQADFPLVKIAGFVALSQKHPKLAADVGMQISLASPKVPRILLSPIFVFFGKEENAQCLLDSLSKLSRTLPNREEQLDDLIEQVPHTLLRKWFESNEVEESSISCNAIVLSRLWMDSHKNNLEPTEKMKAMLLSFKSVPGWPRLVYCECGDEKDESFAENLKLVLMDKSLRNTLLAGIVSGHLDFIRKNINVRMLGLEADRLEFIAKLLQVEANGK